MRLTNRLNLPAPGRRQTLYITFTVSQSPVFLINSRLSHFIATSRGWDAKSLTLRGTPYTEGTGLDCRVPSPELSRAPEATRLAYLCRFMVRSTWDSLEDFLGTPWAQFARLAAHFPARLGVASGGFACLTSYARRRTRPAARLGLFDASPHHVLVAPRRGRNLRLLPIDYASRPRLRGRLTLR